MIYQFNALGYQPIVGDTDGFNFKLPDTYRYTNENPYISNGMSRVTEAGKKYTYRFHLASDISFSVEVARWGTPIKVGGENIPIL